MQGVILLLFAKYYHLPFLRDVQTDCTRTGLGGYWVSRARGEYGPEGGLQDPPPQAPILYPETHPNPSPTHFYAPPLPSLAPPCPSLPVRSLEPIPA